MNIYVLNSICKQIYLGDKQSLELLLVDIDNIINSSAQIIYDKVTDKILYLVEDIKQEMLIKLWLKLSSEQVIFNTEKEVKEYIMNIAEEVLQEIRG